MAASYVIVGAGSAGAVLAARLAEDPAAEVIELGFGADPVDLRRMKGSVRLMHDLARSAEMAAVVRSVAGLDKSVLASEDALTAYVRTNVDTFGHALGTAPMGSPGDQGSVVSQQCRVHGVDNLWVIDASVMPAVPAVPPNLTTIMIAERAATWLAAA